MKAKPLRRAGVFAGLASGPFFLGFGGIEQLGQPWLPSSAWLGIRWRRAGPMAALAGTQTVRDAGCNFRHTGLLIVFLAIAVRDQLPRRRASSFAVVLLALLGVALILAAFRVDVPMLSGGSPVTWQAGCTASRFC